MGVKNRTRGNGLRPFLLKELASMLVHFEETGACCVAIMVYELLLPQEILFKFLGLLFFTPRDGPL